MLFRSVDGDDAMETATNNEPMDTSNQGGSNEDPEMAEKRNSMSTEERTRDFREMLLERGVSLTVNTLEEL